MIRTLAITQNMDLKLNIPLDMLKDSDIKWFWIDFDCPKSEESMLLQSYFEFHPLSIEDCLNFLQRPKLEYYDTYNFFIINALDIENMEAKEIDLFVSDNYLVSFHLDKSLGIECAWEKFINNKEFYDEGPIYAAYLIIDKIVDQYFPFVLQIEDKVDELAENPNGNSIRDLVNRLFEIRGDILKIRRIVNSMRDLLYRIINTSHLEGFRESKHHFNDIHDHLLKLSELTESNLEITADIRDSYLAVNSYRTNSIMMLLTVVTSIFIPLTFIVGIYGMNFRYMPELNWRYGYFLILGLMGLITLMMFYWFKRKGWFDIDR